MRDASANVAHPLVEVLDKIGSPSLEQQVADALMLYPRLKIEIEDQLVVGHDFASRKNADNLNLPASCSIRLAFRIDLTPRYQ